MKVSRIEIKDFQQFKDFELDLTYPLDHKDPKKAGQPLDKVCFIGQSGTGKTTILEVIKEFLSKFVLDSPNINHQINDKVTKKDLYTIFILCNDVISAYKKSLQEHNFREFEVIGYIQNKIDFEKLELNSYYIYLQAGMLYMLNNLSQFDMGVTRSSIENLYTELEDFKNENVELRRKIFAKKYFDFSSNSLKEIWFAILFDSKDYIIERNRLTNLIGKAYIENNDEALNKYKKEYENIEKSQKYPFQKLGQALNPILKLFNIELTSIFDKISDLKFIQLQTGTTVLSFEKWTTGTKQLILSVMPLLGLDTKETIILIDEPENSLFPDIQRTLIKTYTELAPEAQFFFATHSPIIASQFEPWEIVELKFDENGNVYREKFYEGENKVENYTIFPQYLRWDSILTKVFDMEYNSNEARNSKLNELTALEVKLRKLKMQEGASKEEILALWAEYEKLANLLDWQIK